MSDIHARNRYKREIDILIQRLEILQWQKKAYKDLSEDINKKKVELDRLKEDEESLNQIIFDRQTTLDSMWLQIKEIENECKHTENQIVQNRKRAREQIEEYIGNKDKYNDQLNNIKSAISKLELKQEEIQKNTTEAQIEFDRFNDRLYNEKKSLFKKVEDNEELLKKQTKEKKDLEDSLKNLKDEYTELDREYQILLENYILKQ